VIDWTRVGEAIRGLRKQRGWSQGELGHRLGVTAAAVSNWERGIDLTHKRVFDLAPILGVEDPLALLSGNGLPEHKANSTIAQATNLRDRIVPRFNFETVKRRSETVDYADQVRSHFPCSADSFALIVKDRANEPSLLPGDSVIIDPEIAPEPGDMVFALVGLKREPVLRRLNVVKTEPIAEYLLTPINGTWPEYSVGEGAPGEIVGVVSEHTQPRR
jgi:transcriptional regulator with XRE-family HTH domain